MYDCVGSLAAGFSLAAAQASLVLACFVAEHGLWALGLQEQGLPAPGHRLSSGCAWPSCSAACGIFPDEGSNLCLLHWQLDSLPLSHHGS